MRNPMPPPRAAIFWRIAWTLFVILLVESLVFGLAVLPAALVFAFLNDWLPASLWVRAPALSLALAPSYILFALGLMGWSALAMQLTGARTPPDSAMPIAEMGWPLMTWARYLVASHLVRVAAGTIFKGSPIWSAYLRLNGARIGRRVYVNTLSISDHNLLDLGDDVVIGAEVHLSGHTVEGGVVRTGRVRLGRGVTVGLGSVVGIDVEAGDRCQIGALSLVPKHSRLAPEAVYVGIPVVRIDHQPDHRPPVSRPNDGPSGPRLT